MEHHTGHVPFKISPQDVRLGAVTAVSDDDPIDAPLGVLKHLKGHWVGRGFNNIFRPNNGQTQLFSIPVKSSNTLELNLTKEYLHFHDSLGVVPNRGANNEADIFINGVPYTQHVNDVTNITTGEPTNKEKATHFENGIWLHVPATTNNPKTPKSLCRMASIPHGTTINAQGVVSTQEGGNPGKPDIGPVSMTPFLTLLPIEKLPQPSQKAENGNTARLPQDLTPFIKSGYINDRILANPSVVLTDILDAQDVKSVITFQVATSTHEITNPNPVPATQTTKPFLFSSGGGTANINFLDGSNTIHNGTVPDMESTFWIETIGYKLPIPVWKSGDAPLLIQVPPPIPTAAPGPTFQVVPPRDITAPTSIDVTYQQLQYRQKVDLKFDLTTWPHISVATLVPKKLQTVPASAWN